MIRNMLYLGVLAGTVAVPYTIYNGDSWLDSGKGYASSMFSGEETEAASGVDIDELLAMTDVDPTSSTFSQVGGATKSSSDVPIVAMTDALRFDVSPQTVITRWPRVSTMLGELDLDHHLPA